MKFIKKISLFLFIAATISACEKKLTDLQPIDQIPSQLAIQNMADVANALNGIYGTWSARRSIYISSLISDEVRLGTGTEYRNVGNILFNWTHVSDSQDWRDGETGGTWTNLYTVIDRVNRLLELMAPVVPASGSEDVLKIQYRGELLGIRAMAHLELLRCFSKTAEYTPTELGVILQTTYVKAPAAYKPSRNTQAEVMASVNADLLEARGLIPTTFINNSRITRNAIIAGQVRAALHVKNWQGVVDRANEIIPLQPLTPIAGYAAIWTTRTLTENQSTEVIWKLNINSANSGSSIGLLWQDAGTGAVQASPAVKLTNSFDQVNDIRYSTFFKTSPRSLIAKYGFFITGNGETFQYDVKMIRTAEMVLARAEAQAELGQTVPANNDLSSLRSNRITGYTHVAITDKATLISAILQERYKELCYEGQRYFDLKRRSLPIVRDIADVANNTAIQTLNSTDTKYLLPIPQQEKFANPNVQQNAGY
ncbi:MAG: RagB/SusD family nutrient uptake outer membrane protein [Ferruginibacter sp.]|nr:RagB/SusD family nutrient uptake outer membrane protein [Ferruginibacter sp.]